MLVTVHFSDTNKSVNYLSQLIDFTLAAIELCSVVMWKFESHWTLTSHPAFTSLPGLKCFLKQGSWRGKSNVDHHRKLSHKSLHKSHWLIQDTNFGHRPDNTSTLHGHSCILDKYS